MERTAESKSKHDQLVNAMAEMFKTQGYTVKADLPNYNEKPTEWAGCRPDIEAFKNGLVNKRILIEAETCDSLDWETTKAQWQAFSSAPNTLFYVVVPANCIENARAKRKEWAVKIDQFYTIEV